MDPVLEKIFGAAITIAVSLITGAIFRVISRLDKHEEKINKQETSIELNAQRDKLAESFYEKTIGNELRRIDSTLSSIQEDMKEIRDKWEKYIHEILTKK